MRRLHTDNRRSRTASPRLPAVLARRPYLEAKPSPHVLLVAFVTILRTTGVASRACDASVLLRSAIPCPSSGARL
jgi:hypothetical protein